MPHNERRSLRALRHGLLDVGRALAAAESLEELSCVAAEQLRCTLEVKLAAAQLYGEASPAIAFSIDARVVESKAAEAALARLFARARAAWVVMRETLPQLGDAFAIGLRAVEGRPIGVLVVVAPDVDEGDDASELVEILGHFVNLVSARARDLSLHAESGRALRAREDVMAIVAHDLRAPLNNIRIGASLLRDSADNEETLILANIDRSVSHLTRLVDDLSDMVRIDGGSLDVVPKVERLADILDVVEGIVAPTAETARVDLRLPDPEPAQVVFADRHRLVQVLANLIGNAIKFTPAGGLVEVSSNDGDRATVFRICDAGPGIPEAERPHIFERFWRADAKRKRGLGLGLYIAKGIVEAHGGQIDFETVVGIGTTFVFTLPKPPIVTDARGATR
ncbi:MAG: sensor histidine kinase [Polyangiales bacterium]